MTSVLLCIVCAKCETKYKCSKCKAPSCSLNCYKQHQSSCSSTTHAPTPSADDQSPLPQPSSGISEQELRALFARYPELRSELQQIYRSSQGSPQIDAASCDTTRSRPRKVDSEFEVGLKSLDEVLHRDDATSRGLEAFMKLISDEEKLKA